LLPWCTRKGLISCVVRGTEYSARETHATSDGHSPSHTLDVGIVWLSAPVSAQKNLSGLHGVCDVMACASAVPIASETAWASSLSLITFWSTGGAIDARSLQQAAERCACPHTSDRVWARKEQERRVRNRLRRLFLREHPHESVETLERVSGGLLGLLAEGEICSKQELTMTRISTKGRRVGNEDLPDQPHEVGRSRQTQINGESL